MVGVGITAAAATAAGVHYFLNRSSAGKGETEEDVESSGGKKKKRKKKKKKKKKERGVATENNSAATSQAAGSKKAWPLLLISTTQIPGLPALGKKPGSQGEFEQLVDVLTYMYAAQQGTAMCLMAMGRVQDAIKLGFLTQAKRAKLNLSGTVAEDAPTPSRNQRA